MKLDYYFFKISFSIQTIQAYERLLIRDFKDRIGSEMKVTSEYIHLLLEIPYYVSEKIKTAMLTKEHSSVDEFMSEYHTIFLGDIIDRIKLLFNMVLSMLKILFSFLRNSLL